MVSLRLSKVGQGPPMGEVAADEQKVPRELSVNSQKRWIFRTKLSIFLLLAVLQEKLAHTAERC